jgi:hypothetical protein
LPLQHSPLLGHGDHLLEAVVGRSAALGLGLGDEPGRARQEWLNQTTEAVGAMVLGELDPITGTNPKAVGEEKSLKGNGFDGAGRGNRTLTMLSTTGF